MVSHSKKVYKPRQGAFYDFHNLTSVYHHHLHSNPPLHAPLPPLGILSSIFDGSTPNIFTPALQDMGPGELLKVMERSYLLALQNPG